MPRYYYFAVDQQGASLRGTMEAEDPHQLARLLSEQGLFLQSAHLDRRAEVRESEPLPENMSTEFPLYKKIFARHSSRVTTEVALIGFTLLLSFFLPHPARVPRADVEKQIAFIRPGISRRMVEQSLTRYGKGGLSSSRTRYIVGKQVLMDVSYDSTGGDWSPNNRVTAPPRVYKDLVLVDWHLEPRTP